MVISNLMFPWNVTYVRVCGKSLCICSFKQRKSLAAFATLVI